MKIDATSPVICFAAGKSGGHLIPAVSLAKKFITDQFDTKVIFITSNTPLDYSIISKEQNITHIPISFKANTIWKIYYPFLFLHFLKNIFLCLYFLYKYKVNRVESTGGYIALPVCFAAYLLRIPIILHELNVVPGKAIKLLAPFATKIITCFERTQKEFSIHKTYYQSYPLRFNEADQTDHNIAKSKLGFSPSQKTLFILGGSQGSLFINMSIKKWLEQMQQHSNQLQIIHQIGYNERFEWQDFYAKYAIKAYVFSFSDAMPLFYNAADLIITRAGAGTLFEILFFNKPCLAIPLETSQNNHQRYNAIEFASIHPQLITVLFQSQVEKNFSILTQTIEAQLFSSGQSLGGAPKPNTK